MPSGIFQCPHPCGESLPTHASTRGLPKLAGSFGSGSCGVTAYLLWLSVHAKFCLCPPRLEHLFPPVLSVQFISVQFSRSVMSNSLQPHESQHARLPCPSPTPGVHSDSYPSSQWYHPAISSFVLPFSSCPQSLPASESFPMSQLFTLGGQGTRVSALASFFPKKSQCWSASEWTGWISLQSKGLSRPSSSPNFSDKC